MKIVSTTLAGPGTAGELKRALSSVKQFVDECIIIWTGSAAEREAVQLVVASTVSNQGRIVDWSWRNDFGAARQAALDLANASTANWCLWIDTDEWFDFEGLDVRAELAGSNEPARNIFDASRTYTKPKAIRLPCHVKWSGLTHESINVGGTPFSKGVFWERNKSSEELTRKHKRDLRLLELEIRRHPNEARWYYYLGDTYELLGKMNEAIGVFRKRLAMGGWAEEAAWSGYRAACLLYTQKKYEEAIAVAMKGAAAHPGIAELYWIASVSSFYMGRYEHAVHFAELAKVHGARSTCKLKALKARISFRDWGALSWKPLEVQKFAFERLGMLEECKAVQRELEENK
jgi:tetratricopeptide (TPR) repeat protein